MRHYTHLIPFERNEKRYSLFLAEGKSVTEIAHLLKRNKSTISRRLRRMRPLLTDRSHTAP